MLLISVLSRTQDFSATVVLRVQRTKMSVTLSQVSVHVYLDTRVTVVMNVPMRISPTGPAAARPVTVTPMEP